MQCIKTRIEWLRRIIAALTGTCIFGDAVTFINKDCRVLFGDIFIVPFLGPALGWTAMCSPGWGNLVAIDWNDLPVGREFDDKFLKNVKSPPHALPSTPPPPDWLNIDRYIIRGHWCNDIFYVFTISHVHWELIRYSLGIKLPLFSVSILNLLASDLIFSTTVWPAETKNLLNSSATKLLSLLKTRCDLDFFGIQWRIGLSFRYYWCCLGFLYLLNNKVSFCYSDLSFNLLSKELICPTCQRIVCFLCFFVLFVSGFH